MYLPRKNDILKVAAKYTTERRTLMKTDRIFFGAAYYDEYLPYERIELDFQMMKDAGMNTIRIAESTWSTLEPSEGTYDFTHLDRMLE